MPTNYDKELTYKALERAKAETRAARLALSLIPDRDISIGLAVYKIKLALKAERKFKRLYAPYKRADLIAKKLQLTKEQRFKSQYSRLSATADWPIGRLTKGTRRKHQVAERLRLARIARSKPVSGIATHSVENSTPETLNIIKYSEYNV